LRARRLRPHCEPCQASRGRDHAIIDHPPGEETQFDWLELPDPPANWGWGDTAHLLVGALSHCGRWRGVLAESEDQAGAARGRCSAGRVHEAVAVRPDGHRVLPRLRADHGLVRRGRQALRVGVDICPSRHGNRKGVVEKGNHSLAQRWWRTLPDDLSPTQAQARLDAFCAGPGDARRRVRDGQRSTVGELAAAEPLRPVPELAYPTTVELTRVVSAQALVAFRGNFYSVGPGHAGATVAVRHRLGAPILDILTASGVVLARYHRDRTAPR
jgi:hypothetical protein